MRLSTRKLSMQLILPLTAIVMLMGAVAGFLHMRNQESQLLNAMVTGADQLSGSISSATWHAMLADQRTAAYETMQTIAQKQGISRIRIFNKVGKVMFSTLKGDTTQVSKFNDACVTCHSSSRPRIRVDMSSRVKIFRNPDGSRKLDIVTPIYNEPACSNAECHAHPAVMNVLGVLEVALDLNTVDAEIGSIQRRVLIISAVLVGLISLFIFLFTRHFVEKPINRLIEGTRAVSAMHLDQPVEVKGSEELSELARSFEAMRLRLQEALHEINASRQGLEAKVEERTRQLRVAYQKLMNTDRLASLGQLSASVAHEINNPLSGVLNLTMLMQRILKDDGIPPNRVVEFKKYLAQISSETTRVGRIVQDLLAFSRRSKSQQRSKIQFNSVIATTVNLIAHKLKLMNVEIELNLDENLPAIHCDASQMQQVLINLIMNGAEAAQSKGNGKVAVRTEWERKAHLLRLEVADNGDGIPEENMLKIFHPFFTTKGEGKGVGLGLAVVYGIIESHSGDIEVKSRVGQGTTFQVTLPFSIESTAEPADTPDDKAT